MYTNRKSNEGRFTSQGVVSLANSRIEYVPVKNHSGCVLAIGLLVVILIALFIVSHAHAMGTDGAGTPDEYPTHETANPCIPYTHAMVLKGQGFYSHTITLTHGACSGTPEVKHNKHGKTVNPSSVDNAPAVDVPSVKQEHSSDKSVKRCNNGEGNGAEGCSPAKSPNANNDENNTTPKQDKSHGSLPVALSGFIFVTIRKNRKMYYAHVSSWDYDKNGRDVCLYVYADENGEGGHWGVIPNAKVIGTCISASDVYSLSYDLRSIMQEWH